jgi:hypothetical protein
MNRRASMELSVNSIVILVIAVVIMGLLLAFIREKLTAIDVPDAGEIEPRSASSSEPLTLSRESVTVASGKSFTLKANIYNFNATDTYFSLTSTCSGTTLFSKTTSDDVIKISPGDQKTMKILLTVDKTKPRDVYLCSVKATYATTSTNLVSSDEHVGSVTVTVK